MQDHPTQPVHDAREKLRLLLNEYVVQDLSTALDARIDRMETDTRKFFDKIKNEVGELPEAVQRPFAEAVVAQLSLAQIRFQGSLDATLANQRQSLNQLFSDLGAMPAALDTVGQNQLALGKYFENLAAQQQRFETQIRRLRALTLAGVALAALTLTALILVLVKPV